MSEPREYTAEELRVGLRTTYERDISEADVLTFGRLSGDLNPLHTDAGYAETTTFGARIVHGAFQIGLASAFLGVHLPGKHVLLGSVHAQFPAPLFFPGRVVVAGEITAWNLDSRSGRMRIAIQEARSRVPTAEILVGFTLHDRAVPANEQGLVVPAAQADPGAAGGRRLVAVTGASGDLGQRIVADLAGTYEVLALVNRGSLRDGHDTSHVTQVRLDLTAPDAGDQLRTAIAGRSLFGIVHAAWPGAPRTGLLDADSALIDSQVGFASVVTVGLAKILFDCAPEEGGRFVAISSTAGSVEPQLPLAVYSLGKACLDRTVQLLAPELALKRITMNAVSPSFMSIGMNRRASERVTGRAAASVPAGRLCSSADVVALTRYLLSDDASFVSGQILPLTGAKLQAL